MGRYLLIAGCAAVLFFVFVLAIAPFMLSSQISREEEAAARQAQEGKQECA